MRDNASEGQPLPQRKEGAPAAMAMKPGIRPPFYANQAGIADADRIDK
mgnify:FL=1